MKNLFSFCLNVSTALFLLMFACTEKPDTNSSTNSFSDFALSFPQKLLPLSLPVNPDYTEEDLKLISSKLLKEYFSSFIFDLPLEVRFDEEEPLLIFGRVDLQKDIYSLIVYQHSVVMGTYQYTLLNFDINGQLLSYTPLAFYHGGSGVAYQLSSILEKDQIKFKEEELPRREDVDYDNMMAYALSLKSNGNLVPVDYPSEIVASYLYTKNEHGKYHILEYCFEGAESFEILTAEGLDFPIYRTFPSGSDAFIKEIRLMKTAFIYIIQSPETDEPPYQVKLNRVENEPGLFRMSYGTDVSFVINSNYRNNYGLIKEQPCIPNHLIIHDNGIGEARLGFHTDWIKQEAEKHGFELMVDFIEIEPGKGEENVYSLFDEQTGMVAQIRADERSVISQIRILKPHYLTEEGLGVGSSLKDIRSTFNLLFAYSSEEGIMLLTPKYDHLSFILDFDSTSEEIRGPDQKLNLDDIRLDAKVKQVFIR